MNGYGKLRRCTDKRKGCTDKRKVVVEFYLYLAAALTVIRRLIGRARILYRWPNRPTTADSANHQLPVALILRFTPMAQQPVETLARAFELHLHKVEQSRSHGWK